ncbi:MAG: N-acetylornithine carbamoyltransferase [Cytophagales bacterium]|nr:N-acetylornithine carbamoyltransferase [Cytophagales bacterium]
MRHFTSVHDVPLLNQLLQTAREVKQAPFSHKALGTNRSLCAIFLNPSLRTRLSTQRAAANLGMDCTVLNLDGEGWKIEFADGAVMNGDKAEHIKEAAGVIGAYYDVVALRSFPLLQDRQADYADHTLRQFIKYCGKPVVSLESCTRHPLQSLADVITIETHKKTTRPKVVLTWAPHPRALPQAVPNSFAEWMNAMDYELVITHPEGYELHPDFVGQAQVEYDQRRAFEGADFIYAKNWSSYARYGQILSTDPTWTVDAAKMALTSEAKFMHCLPVRRNVIVTDEVIDSPQSVVLEQAANRIVAAQAVLQEILSSVS